MDIKIKFMQKMAFLLMFLFFSSCSVFYNNKKDLKNFKDEFKFQAYCSCVISGYDNKNLTTKMVGLDKSFYNPIINSVFSKEIIAIGIEEGKIMKLDSINSIQKFSEGKSGKTILKHCLKFYSSKKLDSIAKVKFKEWKNIKNLDSVLQKNIPAF